MKDKKGFTLIEVIITIAILGLLAGICIPIVVKYVKQGKDKYYKSLEDELVVIAKNYYSDSRSELPRGQIDRGGNAIYINQVTIDRLRDKGYFINDVVDVNDEPCTGYVRVENNKGNYVYYPCLICNDGYKTDGEYCFWDGSNTNNNTLACDINFKNGYEINKWTNKDVEIEVVGSYRNSTSVPNIYLYKTNSGLSIKPINNVGNYKVTQTTDSLSFTTYDGVKNATCNINGTIKIDKEMPTCELSYVISDDGASSVITLKGQDELSEVNTMILNDEEMFFLSYGSIAEVSEVFHEEKTYTASVKDTAGNATDCSVAVTGLDKTAPDVDLLTNIGQINATMTDDFALAGYQITPNNEIPTRWVTLNSIKIFTHTFEETVSGTYYVWAKDKAGHIGSESIYLDMTKPTVTLTNEKEGLTAELRDDVGVMAYQITTDDKTPTRWNGISSTKEKTVLFENLSGGTYYVWAKDTIGNIGVESIFIQSKKPTVIVTTTNTTSSDEVAKVTINATINDEDDGVNGWAITTSEDEPTNWNLVDVVSTYSFSVDKSDIGTYYVWAKDVTNNKDYKKVIIQLDPWSEYDVASCNVKNNLLCQIQTQYKKETRTVTKTQDCSPYACNWYCDTSGRVVTGYNTVYSCPAGGSLSGSRCYFTSPYLNNSACKTSCGSEFGGTCNGSVCSYSKPATSSQSPIYGCPAGFTWDGSLCEKCYFHDTCYNKCITEWSAVTVTYEASCENVMTSGYNTNDWTTKCSDATLYSKRSYVVVVE